MIYTKFGKQKTIREFIKLLYSCEKYENQLKNVETYSNKECTIIQCHENKFRSFDDIFECVKTYYKNISPKMLIHILLTMNFKSSTSRQLYLHMSNCSGIQKQRFLFYTCYSGNITFTCDQYTSKWSWNELLQMLGINNQNELEAYVSKHTK